MFTFKNIFLAVSVIAALVFAYLYFTKKCNVYGSDSTTLRDSLNRFITIRLKDSSTIVEQNQYILKQKDAIDAGVLRETQLKRYVAQVRLETKESRSFAVETKPTNPESPYFTKEDLDSVLQARKDSVSKLPAGYAVVDTNQVHQVPREITKDDQWFTLRGTDGKDSTHFDVVAFYNKLSITIGSRKMGFFKARKPLVIVKNENPYSETLNMENVVIKYKEPFYKRPWFIATATAAVIEGVRYTLKRK